MGFDHIIREKPLIDFHHKGHSFPEERNWKKEILL
jgi:hypothetical protein